MTQPAPHMTLTDPDRPPASFVGVALRLADENDDVLLRHIQMLRDCVALAQHRWSFGVEAAVVLPGAIHMLWAHNDQRFDAGAAVSLIRIAFAHHLLRHHRPVWSDRLDMIDVDPTMVAQYRSMIEAEPVRTGLVRQAMEWPFSSANVGAPEVLPVGNAVA